MGDIHDLMKEKGVDKIIATPTSGPNKGRQIEVSPDFIEDPETGVRVPTGIVIAPEDAARTNFHDANGNQLALTPDVERALEALLEDLNATHDKEWDPEELDKCLKLGESPFAEALLNALNEVGLDEIHAVPGRGPNKGKKIVLDAQHDPETSKRPNRILELQVIHGKSSST